MKRILQTTLLTGFMLVMLIQAFAQSEKAEAAIQSIMQSEEQLKEIVRQKYSEIALQDKADNMASCCGAGGCSTEVYNIMSEDYTTLEGYNADADLGLGCGLPTQFARIKKGDIVIDLGSGAGNDCFIARHETGETGKVIGVDFRPFPKSWNLQNILGEYETNQARWYEYTVMRQVELLTNKQLAIIFDCGVDDIFITVNRALHEKLLQLKIDHDYIERSGGHNHAYWRSSIDFQMLYFHQFFQKN